MHAGAQTYMYKSCMYEYMPATTGGSAADLRYILHTYSLLYNYTYNLVQDTAIKLLDGIRQVFCFANNNYEVTLKNNDGISLSCSV